MNTRCVKCGSSLRVECCERVECENYGVHVQQLDTRDLVLVAWRDRSLSPAARAVYDFLVTHVLSAFEGDPRSISIAAAAMSADMNRVTFAISLDALVSRGYIVEHQTGFSNRSFSLGRGALKRGDA